MAESSERVLTPDEASYRAVSRVHAFVPYEGVRPPRGSTLALRLEAP